GPRLPRGAQAVRKLERENSRPPRNARVAKSIAVSVRRPLAFAQRFVDMPPGVRVEAWPSTAANRSRARRSVTSEPWPSAPPGVVPTPCGGVSDREGARAGRTYRASVERRIPVYREQLASPAGVPARERDQNRDSYGGIHPHRRRRPGVPGHA